LTEKEDIAKKNHYSVKYRDFGGKMTGIIHFLLLIAFVFMGMYFSLTDPTGLSGNLYFNK